MKTYLTNKNAQTNIKNTNFRSWKSGKQWLYASSLIIGLAAGGAIAAQPLTASADGVSTAAPVLTATVASSATSVAPTQSANHAASNTSSASAVASVAASNSVATPTQSVAMVAASVATQPASVTTNSLVASSSVTVNTTAALPDVIGMLGNTIGGLLGSASSTNILSSGVAGSTGLGLNNVLGTIGNVVSSLTNPATSAVSSAVSMTSSAVSTSFVAPDLSAIANSINTAYNTSLGNALSMLISSQGAAQGLNVLMDLTKTAGSLLGFVPGVGGVISIVNGALGAAKTALTFAGSTGLDPLKLVSGVMNQALSALGNGLLAVITPVVSKIPLVGTAILNAVKPLLSDLSSVSVAKVVDTLAAAAGLTGVLSIVSGVANMVAPLVINGLQMVLNFGATILNVLTPIVAPVINMATGAAKGLVNGGLNAVTSLGGNVLKSGIGGVVPSIGTAILNVFYQVANILKSLPVIGSLFPTSAVMSIANMIAKFFPGSTTGLLGSQATKLPAAQHA